MVDADEWRMRVKCILKAELKRRNVTHEELAVRLGAVGVRLAPQSISNRISRGTFSAVFFVQCLAVIGAAQVRLD